MKDIVCFNCGGQMVYDASFCMECGKSALCAPVVPKRSDSVEDTDDWDAQIERNRKQRKLDLWENTETPATNDFQPIPKSAATEIFPTAHEEPIEEYIHEPISEPAGIEIPEIFAEAETETVGDLATRLRQVAALDYEYTPPVKSEIPGILAGQRVHTMESVAKNKHSQKPIAKALSIFFILVIAGAGIFSFLYFFPSTPPVHSAPLGAESLTVQHYATSETLIVNVGSRDAVLDAGGVQMRIVLLSADGTQRYSRLVNGMPISANFSLSVFTVEITHFFVEVMRGQIIIDPATHTAGEIPLRTGNIVI